MNEDIQKWSSINAAWAINLTEMRLIGLNDWNWSNQLAGIKQPKKKRQARMARKH